MDKIEKIDSPKDNPNPWLIALGTMAFIGIALYGAYAAGLMEAAEKQMAYYWLKTKAKAQEQKLKSLGKVEGVDFSKAELPGNKQAEDVLDKGLGDVEGKMGLGGNGAGSVGEGVGDGVGALGGGVGEGLGGLKKGVIG